MSHSQGGYKVDLIVESAHDLYNADGWLAGKSDPYCVVSVLGKKHIKEIKTQTLNNNLNPVWNHQGEIHGVSAEDTLVFEVFDADVLSSTSLGKAHVTAHEFMHHGLERSLHLSGEKATGTLRVRLYPFVGAEVHGRGAEVRGSVAMTYGAPAMTYGAPMQSVVMNRSLVAAEPMVGEAMTYAAPVQTIGQSIMLQAPAVRSAAMSVEREVTQMPQVSTIQYVHHIQEHIKEVEVPEVEIHNYEEDHVQRYVQEEMAVVERLQMHDLIREELVPEVVERIKEVQKPTYHAREIVAEIPHIVTHEKVVEIDQPRIIDLVREVPREVRQITSKQIHKPVNQFREVCVEVPHTTTTERLQEVPVHERAEILKQVPGQMIVEEVIKPVNKHEIEVQTVHEDCVHIEYEERLIEVPQVEVREVVKQVPKIIVEVIEKRVEKKIIEYVERIVEVPHVIYEERIVEVPELEIREVIRKVPKPVTQLVDKPITKRENRYIERIVEVPHVLEQERAVEVPQVVTVETQTQVLRPQWEHREKAVEKIVIEPREVLIETPVVTQHEQAVEFEERQIVDLVREVHRPVHEVREKTVPHMTTEVIEEQQDVITTLRREMPQYVPQVQEVEILIEKPQPVIREIEKEIPKWRMQYNEVEKMVKPKFVIPDPEEESMMQRGIISREVEFQAHEYQGFSLGGENESDFVVQKRRGVGVQQQAVMEYGVPVASQRLVQTQTALPVTSQRFVQAGFAQGSVAQGSVQRGLEVVEERSPAAAAQQTGFFASIKHALGFDGQAAHTHHGGSHTAPHGASHGAPVAVHGQQFATQTIQAGGAFRGGQSVIMQPGAQVQTVAPMTVSATRAVGQPMTSSVIMQPMMQPARPAYR